MLVCSGIIKDVDSIEYNLEVEKIEDAKLNSQLALQSQQEWNMYQSDILFKIYQLALDNTNDGSIYKEQLSDVLYNIEWKHKANNLYDLNNYHWFYLRVNHSIEGVCVVSFPEDSKLTTNNKLCYIDFIAVSPQNRKSHNKALSTRKFQGLGTMLIKIVLQYAINYFKADYGLCLHSLEQSRNFYDNLQMNYLEKHNYSGLYYYEMTDTIANNLYSTYKDCK